jgi:hypothetical protein
LPDEDNYHSCYPTQTFCSEPIVFWGHAPKLPGSASPNLGPNSMLVNMVVETNAFAFFLEKKLRRLFSVIKSKLLLRTNGFFGISFELTAMDLAPRHLEYVFKLSSAGRTLDRPLFEALEL